MITKLEKTLGLTPQNKDKTKPYKPVTNNGIQNHHSRGRLGLKYSLLAQTLLLLKHNLFSPCADPEGAWGPDSAEKSQKYRVS